MANLQGTTVTGNLAVTGSAGGQGMVPVGAVLPVVSALTGSHTIPNTGTVDADGWQYCDGAVIPSSQTLEGTTPNLTDGRFLRGFTSSSGCGGAATFTLALGNLAAHDHGGAITSASTTPGVTGSCGQTSSACGGTVSGSCGQTTASTTPGATGACGQTTASTTPGATGGCCLCNVHCVPGATGSCGQTTSGCGQTTSACAATSGTVSSWHTHTFTTGGQNCQHCHCVCDAGTHSHATGIKTCSSSGSVCSLFAYNSKTGGWRGGHASTDGRHHCAQHTCCTYNGTPHLHSGTTANPNLNHSHGLPNHSHTTPSHTHTTPAHTHTSCGHNHTSPNHSHTSAAHTHTTPSHSHTSAAHTHTTPAHTHTMGSHTHTTPAHTHTSAAHTHATTVASAGSGTAKSHIPIYFNVKYLIRVI